MRSRTLITLSLLGSGCGEFVPAASGSVLSATPSVMQPPLAHAGADEEVLRGFPAVLRGTGSYHPAGVSFNARWEQIDGQRVTLSNPESLQPTLIAPLTEQVLTFRLRVDDGRWSTDDTVTLRVVREPTRIAPVVRAGPDRIVDSTDSAGPDEGDIVAAPELARWEAVAVEPSTFSNRVEDYTGPRPFRLSAARDELQSAPDYLLLVADENDDTSSSGVGRQAPVSSVQGPEVVSPGARFILDATDSTDSNGDSLRYRWEQVRGEPALDPSDAGLARRELSAPSRSQELLFRVYASDGQLESTPAELQVVIRPFEETSLLDLSVGLDLRSRPGREVRLNASLLVGEPETTQDSGEERLAFEWLQTIGSDVDLTIEDDGSALFLAPPSIETLAFVLVASDSASLSNPSVSTVSIVDDETNTPPVVFLCSSVSAPEAGQSVVLAAEIYDPEGDALSSPQWSSSFDIDLTNQTTPRVGTTCAGEPPSVHGGPQQSATVSSVSFEMPEVDDDFVRVDVEVCDELLSCTKVAFDFANPL